jgi:16S rRNA (cytidine1402-2'-O)-methyltransferase
MSPQLENALFVVATPIGNLKDITLRAIEILSGADLVVSEHVRKTRNLLRHYGVKQNVASYREDNVARMIPSVLRALEEGRAVALVAEAGTPAISDPGRRLVAEARRAGFRVVPVPGASAVAAAVSVAGLDDPRFVFEGFLPRRSGKRRKRLLELAPDPRPLVVFEAPHRLLDCLKDMRSTLGDRTCLVAREMTKLHEEIISGFLSDAIAKFGESAPTGEFVIVIQGSPEGTGGQITPQVVEEAKELAAQGVKKARAARIVARKYGLKARDLYAILTDEQESAERGDGK